MWNKWSRWDLRNIRRTQKEKLNTYHRIASLSQHITLPSIHNTHIHRSPRCINRVSHETEQSKLALQKKYQSSSKWKLNSCPFVIRDLTNKSSSYFVALWVSLVYTDGNVIDWCHPTAAVISKHTVFKTFFKFHFITNWREVVLSKTISDIPFSAQVVLTYFYD